MNMRTATYQGFSKVPHLSIKPKNLLPRCAATVYTPVERFPLTPLEKGGTGSEVPLLKGDLGGSCKALASQPRSVYTAALRESAGF